MTEERLKKIEANAPLASSPIFIAELAGEVRLAWRALDLAAQANVDKDALLEAARGALSEISAVTADVEKLAEKALAVLGA